MKQKYIYLSLFLFSLLFFACREDEVETWETNDYIHFGGGYEKFYSFVYSGPTVTKDTINLRMNIAGELANYDRHYKIKQVMSYKFEYELDEFGNAVDSAFIEVENQAVPGEHYLGLDDPAYSELTVPADSLGTFFQLIVLRHESLKEKDYVLTLEVQESNDFSPGYAVQQKATLTISDRIIEPTLWKTEKIGQKTVWSVMGEYGKKKHQLLIDTSGKRWDDRFIRSELTEEYLTFYKMVAVEELQRINDKRAEEGLFPLREDDNNPNSEIKFF